MPIEIVVAIIGAIQAIGVAIIGGIITSNHKKDDAAREARAEQEMVEREKRAKQEQAREKRDAANYDLLFSVADGVEVLLEQAHGDKMNGNVEKALQSVRAAKSKCNHVYNEQVAKI